MIENTIIKFKRITKYNLLKYFEDCEFFFKNYLPNIVDFYNGKIKQINSINIREQKRLLEESENVNSQFRNNANKMNTVDYWELLDFCDDLRTKLQTTAKLSKYLRSSRTGFNYSRGFSHPYTIANEQTLENISSDVLKNQNFDDDWVNIALTNDLKETQYDIDGGDNIVLYREIFIQNFVTSVIDNMIGEKIYGLDIKSKITFKDNDLEVLSYKDTVFQAVDILSKLRKGDIPEYKYLGVNSGLYAGSNIANLSYSAIVREMTRVFSTDDLFINFKINEIELKEDSFFIKFQVETKYKMLIETTTLI